MGGLAERVSLSERACTPTSPSLGAGAASVDIWLQSCATIQGQIWPGQRQQGKRKLVEHIAWCSESTAPFARGSCGRRGSQVGGMIAQTTVAEPACLKQITARGQSARKGTLLQIT